MKVEEIDEGMINTVIELYKSNGLFIEKEEVVRPKLCLPQQEPRKRGRPTMEIPTFDLMGLMIKIKDGCLIGGPFMSQDDARSWLITNQ